MPSAKSPGRATTPKGSRHPIVRAAPGLLPGYQMLPGKAHRVQTPSGTTISNRAYRKIVTGTTVEAYRDVRARIFGRGGLDRATALRDDFRVAYFKRTGVYLTRSQANENPDFIRAKRLLRESAHAKPHKAWRRDPLLRKRAEALEIVGRRDADIDFYAPGSAKIVEVDE